ncbi:hypothetical protein [Candidatus Similichlamydia laticola]|uniref:hypothetical protein n=1 Tax=Candidatus Similichlamydia laticola TaxID=2170265 RepID=UPI0011C05C9B|nr:hypothetical protein [Candidatus Similichlamydia laticola]
MFHLRTCTIKEEDMMLYIQEAQDRPFDLLKKDILVHPILEPIYEDFYGTCLLLIQKNSSCTKEGGYLSHEDLALVEQRVSCLIEEVKHDLYQRINFFPFGMWLSLGMGLFGFLYTLSVDWSLEPPPLLSTYSFDLVFPLLALLNGMTCLSYHYWLQRYVSLTVEGAHSLFLRIRQSVEIQYKRVTS